MFFFFPWANDESNRGFLKARDYRECESQKRRLNSNEYFVYGESVWGEGVWTESSTNLTYSLWAHENSHKETKLNVSEKFNKVDIKNTASKIGIEKLNEISGQSIKKKIIRPPGLYFLSMVDFFYSAKTVKEVFKETINDWHEEYFEALNKKEFGKIRWINVRYTYAFFMTIWQKSPIGDLIEFIRKVAK